MRSVAWVQGTAGLLCASALICCAEPKEPVRSAADADHANQQCPARTEAAPRLPGTRPAQQTLDYWLAQYSASELDRPILEVADVQAYNRRMGLRPGHAPHSQRDLGAPFDPLVLQRDVAQRLAYLRDRLTDGRYVTESGQDLSEEELQAFSQVPLGTTQALRVALEEIPIRCGPYPRPLYKSEGARDLDRNACSSLRPQEVVQVLSSSDDGMQWVRTRYAMGFIAADAPLSPSLPNALRQAFIHGPRLRAEATTTLHDRDGQLHELSKHTRLATASGIVRVDEAGQLASTRRPLTRRALLDSAFRYIDSPYGFGGQAGGRDCSRFIMDLFESFDLRLPRHSGWQAKAGTFALDVARQSEQQKLRSLELAAEHGAVLLYFPGHIMLYLGRDEDGRDMAIHALGEYARPCSGGGETVVDVRRTVVSDLELGRGSSRTSFIERLTKLVVIGAPPSAQLASLGEARQAPPPQMPEPDATCRDDASVRIFYSPRRPVAGKPVRVIAVSTSDPGQAQLRLWAPDGTEVPSVERKLGGPPYTRWTRIDRAQPGRYTAVLGSGAQALACKRFGARRGLSPQEAAEIDEPVWQPRWSWEQDTLNLWAAFVEQLFDYPPDDTRTWTNLHDLLRDPDRNLLHNHLGLREDARLKLEPDCADLPYVLRAYFAWKTRLPFAFRRCTRGRPGTPPDCGPTVTNLEPRVARDELQAFSHFANRQVRSGVHSASGRTHPQDDQTDLYPVALNRSALPPGTVYADPYGHVMMISRWYPQSGDGYGVLMAAEAQPDGTVGRRRFWQGSFLFDPSTDDVGAGFKQFRPITFDSDTGILSSLDNAELRGSGDFAPFSSQQYEITRDDFYDRMDALINPQPLDPRARLLSLIDALQESVDRRVLAVQNGEDHMAEQRYAVMPMPHGHEIFETQGPWEDFSTPSRDMRLLISIDTVVDFPALVARAPERFNLSAGAHDAAVTKLEQQLRQELEARSFTYLRSDGSSHTLSLAQLLQRTERLELGYNPNDCVELRWGASQADAEFGTCKRHAPAEQRARMTRYRQWFHTRTRPPRGTR